MCMTSDRDSEQFFFEQILFKGDTDYVVSKVSDSRLVQSVERKTLNLVVVGLNLTLGETLMEHLRIPLTPPVQPSVYETFRSFSFRFSSLITPTMYSLQFSLYLL